MPDEFGSAGDSGSGSGAAVASPAPSTETGASSSPGTTAPGTSSGTQTPSFPDVPYSRFDEVNKGYQGLKWAEAYQPEQVSQQQAFFQWLNTDPEGAFRYMEDYLTRSGALKQRQQAQAQAPPPNGGRPQPDVVIPETGQKFYSAEAAEKLAHWTADSLLTERLSPIETSLQQVEQDRQSWQANQAAQATLQDADTWPHFKGHEREILSEMERDQRLSLEGAYRRVVFPKLRQLEREAIVNETKQKASASTVNPGAAGAGTTVDASKLSWEDTFRREYAKRRG